MEMSQDLRTPLYALAFLASSMMVTKDASAEEIHLGKVDGWSINYDNAENGVCSAVGTYEGGTTLDVLYLGPGNTWALIITNPKWTSVVKDREYQTEYIFNQRRGWKGADRGVKNGLLSYGLKPDFIEDFARSSVLDIKLGNRTIDRISLRGTRAAINALKDCYESRIDRLDPFADQAPPAEASEPAPEGDVDLKRMTTFSGKCRYQLFADFLNCKDAVLFGEHKNGRLQLIFVSDQMIYSLSGGSDRQPNLNNYYMAVDTLRITPSGSGDKPAEDRGMEGECHFTLNDDATEFYFIKCVVYNRAKGNQYRFNLENITGFDRKDF